MADRYWVGGTGYWNSSATTHWSTSSGGSSGASVPTSSDNVIFDSNSASADYTVSAIADDTSSVCNNLELSNPSSGTLTIDAGRVNIYGNLNIISGDLDPSRINMRATSTGKTITTNGNYVKASIYFEGVGGEWKLQDKFDSYYFGGIYLYHGTFDLNNQDIRCRSFDGSGTSTRALKMGSGTFEVTQSGTVWDLETTTNLTFTKGTGTIKFSGSLGTSDKTFNGGGLTYYNFWNSVYTSGDLATNTGKTIINGSNTFNNFKGSSIFSTRLEFEKGTTQTATSFSFRSESTTYENIMQGSDDSEFTLSCASGTVEGYYLNLKHSTVKGGATWKAQESIDGGDNSGWTFYDSIAVTTSACTNTDEDSTTGNGNITSIGGESVTERGFCYKEGTTGDPTTSDSKVYDTGTYSTGSFTKSITGLSSDTSYRVKAYATNSIGTAYGTTVSIKTETSETEATATLAGLATLEEIKKATLAGLIFAEATKIAQVAGIASLETLGKNTLAGISSFEGYERKTLAGVADFELQNVRKTLAGISSFETEGKETLSGIVEMEDEGINTISGITTFEDEGVNTLAGTVFLESTKTDQIAGLSNLETEGKNTLGGIVIFEQTKKSTVAGLSTFEDEGLKQVAGISELELVKKDTLAGTSSLDKHLLAYSWQRKSWYDGTRYWRASYDWDNNRIRFDYTTDGITFTENTSARITDASVNSDFSVKKKGTGEIVILYSNGTSLYVRNSTGTYPGTAFTWSASVTVATGDTTNKYIYPELSLMKSNKWQVVYTHHDITAGTYYIETKDSVSTNISSWTSATILSDTANTDKNCFGVIERTDLNTETGIAIWTRGTTLEYKKKTSGAWDASATTITTSKKSGTENAFACDNYITNSELFIVYVKTDGSLVGRKYTDAGGMLAEDILDDGIGDLNLYPAMVQHTGGSMFAVWIKGLNIYLVQRNSDGTIIPKQVVTNGLDPESSWLNINENSGLGSIGAIWQEGETLMTEIIDYLRVAQVAGISTFETTGKNTLAGLTSFEDEGIDTLAGEVMLEYENESTLAGLTYLEATAVSTLAGTSNFDSYYSFATLAGLVFLEREGKNTLAGISEFEIIERKTLSGISTFEDGNIDNLAGIIEFEKEENNTLAGIIEFESIKKDTVSGISEFEGTSKNTVAGFACFEKTNALETLAGTSFFEHERKVTVAGIADFERVVINNIAGTSEFEREESENIAGLVELETENIETLSGIIAFEKENTDNLAGITTLEKITVNGIAGTANFYIQVYPYSTSNNKPYNTIK